MKPKFDFATLPVPFAMRPGLRRLLDVSSAFTPADAQVATEKRAAWGSAVSPLRLADGCSDDAGLLHALRWLQSFAIQSIAKDVQKSPTCGQFPSKTEFQSLSEALGEDLAVIDGRTAAGRIPWACVALPSYWAPEEKVGKSLAEIHAPVADNALLQAASAGLVKLATSGEAWERSVWTLSSDLRLDQHPVRQQRLPWSLEHLTGDVASLAYIGWRWERQCIVPVPGLEGADDTQRLAIFTIRVFTEPLIEALRASEEPDANALKLAASLASMSDAVLDYKSLRAVRDPAVAALRAYAASAT